MNGLVTSLRARVGIAATLGTIALIIAAAVAPLGTSYAGEPAEQTGQGSERRAGQLPSSNAYNLQGDTFNPTGSSFTVFLTTSGDDAAGAWYFITSSSSANVVALHGDANSSATGTGVRGEGGGRGVYGQSPSGFGVYGTTGGGGSVAGVKGISTGANSSGVWGSADNGSGSAGVYGTSNSAIGVWGVTNSATGAGVYGVSSAGNGVTGQSTSANGVYGISQSGVALFGNNTGNGSGFYGFSLGGPGGVMGSNVTEGARFYTRNASSYAMVTGGLSGTYGNVYITGNYQATGTKSARVETSQGPRLMYATEGTQNIFTDQGTAQLVNGRAIITIDPLYAQTVSLNEPYQVFLTPHSADTQGLAAINLTPTGFEVRELAKGQGSFAFSWKVEALRKGYEKDRLEDAGPAPASGGKAYEMPAVAQPPAEKPLK